jgi:hypothetical protein
MHCLFVDLGFICGWLKDVLRNTPLQLVFTLRSNSVYYILSHLSLPTPSLSASACALDARMVVVGLELVLSGGADVVVDAWGQVKQTISKNCCRVWPAMTGAGRRTPLELRFSTVAL